MSTVRSPWIWLLIGICVLPVGLYIVFWISLYGIAVLDEGWHLAWFGNSSYAEVIVLVPDNSTEGFSVELIPVSSAESYRSAHPGSTFLIPIERQSQFRNALRPTSSCRGRPSKSRSSPIARSKSPFTLWTGQTIPTALVTEPGKTECSWKATATSTSGQHWHRADGRVRDAGRQRPGLWVFRSSCHLALAQESPRPKRSGMNRRAVGSFDGLFYP